MTKSAWSVVLLAFLSAYGCADDDANCVEMAGHPDCLPSCLEDPSLPGCDAFDLGMPDEGVPDAGPCGMCAADTVCDPASGSCVACLGDGDCMDGVCLVDDADSANNECVGCVDSDDCTDGVCDTGSNTCVGCLADGDCDSVTASACDTDTNTCVGCSADAQCTRLTDTPVCDEGAETCVECTADDESACGDNVCDVAAGTCTSIAAGETGLCQECVSDRQCSPGRVCVAMEFMDAPVGNFCLWRVDATGGGAPNGACVNSPPYADRQEDVTTMNGASVTICSLALTTCEALGDYPATACDTPFDSDDQCGTPGVADGLCRNREAAVNRCTIPCLGDDDCIEGSTCNTGETPRYCNF